jgi:hypothetical protein
MGTCSGNILKQNIKNIKKTFSPRVRSRAVDLARQAHVLKVVGSNPTSAFVYKVKKPRHSWRS